MKKRHAIVVVSAVVVLAAGSLAVWSLRRNRKPGTQNVARVESPPKSSLPHTLAVRAAYYRLKTPADPGSASVLVHNTSDAPVEIDQLLMDGSRLPALGIADGLTRRPDLSPVEQLAAARIIWARLEPNPIPPGRSSLLYVQYRTRPLMRSCSA